MKLHNVLMFIVGIIFLFTVTYVGIDSARQKRAVKQVEKVQGVKQNLYASCYDYCKKESSALNKMLWALMNRIEQQQDEIDRLTNELQTAQSNKSMSTVPHCDVK